MNRFRGGLVFEAQRLFYHPPLGSRVIKKQKQTPARVKTYFQGRVGVKGSKGKPRRPRTYPLSVRPLCFSPSLLSSLPPSLPPVLQHRHSGPRSVLDTLISCKTIKRRVFRSVKRIVSALGGGGTSAPSDEMQDVIWKVIREKIFMEFMTSDRNLKASSEGSKRWNDGT